MGTADDTGNTVDRAVGMEVDMASTGILVDIVEVDTLANT